MTKPRQTRLASQNLDSRQNLEPRVAQSRGSGRTARIPSTETHGRMIAPNYTKC